MSKTPIACVQMDVAIGDVEASQHIINAEIHPRFQAKPERQE